MSRIGERIQKLRRLRNRTSREIAQKIGVPESTYRSWEAGRLIRGEPYVALAEALGVSLYELLSGEKPDHRGLIELSEELERRAVELRRQLIVRN